MFEQSEDFARPRGSVVMRSLGNPILEGRPPSTALLLLPPSCRRWLRQVVAPEPNGGWLPGCREPRHRLRGGKSTEVEAIEVHDLVPRRHEVTHELLLRVVTCVDLRDGSELGVRTEDEVDGGGGPLDLARGAIATLEHVLSRDGCLPLRAHVEQVHEEVIGQRLGPVGEDAVSGLPGVGVQGPHAADEDRHLGSGQISA